MEKRTTFSGSIGFVLAAAASAVGLGNIWRFPYLAAKYGGGVFLLFYIIFVVTFGFSIMIAENAIGRRTGMSALHAFGALNRKWGFVGILATIVPAIILPYYNVIGGWVIKYCTGYIFGQSEAFANNEAFSEMLQSPGLLILFQFIFTLLTSIIVGLGIDKGIERFSKILMPILIVLTIIIAIYSITLPGAGQGVKHFIIPDFSGFTPSTILKSILGAMGQMFYSLSLAMGIMISYGSYLPKDTDLEKSVTKIEIFDTAIAILAGLMIIPAIYAFAGGNQEVLSSSLKSGPGLMFIVLPQVFAKMGMSGIMGSVFFLLVLFAALTSSVSIMEAIVPAVMEKFNMKRVKATIIIGLFAFIVGSVIALDYKYKFIRWGENGNTLLDTMDFISNSILMPITAFLTCIFVGYIVGVKTIDDEVSLSGKFKRRCIFNVMIKYVAPIFIIAILISSILSSLGIFSI